METSHSASVVCWIEFLATDPEVRIRFPALSACLRSSGPGTESTQPHECESYMKEKVTASV
jgi:hypothetical protein